MRLTAVSPRKMNISQFSLLVFAISLFTSAVGVLSECRDSRSDVTPTASQHTKVKSARVPRAAPTPLPKDWRGLVPLESTRSDVERILGKPRTGRYSTYIYDTADDRIDVLYSEGPCEATEVERWNVPKDVVIRIDVRPKLAVFVKALVLDKNRYVRIRESHPSNWFSYSNNDDGIRVETIKTGQVEEVSLITYGPKAKDQSLRCPRD